MPRAVDKVKAKRFAALKASGLSNREASRQLSPNGSSGMIQSQAYRMANNPYVQDQVARALDEAGFNVLEHIKILIKRSKSATRPVYRNDQVVGHTPDWAARNKATEMLFRLAQAYARKEPDPYIPPPPTEPVSDGALRAALTQALANGDIQAIERIVFDPNRKRTELPSDE